tara:strand:+ start:295 stop:507 length:213 start_codon:yes stop_codon:yes gene_type:complete
MAKTKADYYEWLMKKHDVVSQQLRAIPKIPLDIQAKSAQLNEYDDVNRRKVNFYNKILHQINAETTRILQ